MGKWLGIVGEGFDNDDGSSRQAEIARCEVGETVSLQHDSKNRHDPNCVRVLSRRGVQIGFLSKEHAAVFASHIRQGHEIEAEIAKINGGTKGKPSWGVVIEADVDEDDFEQALHHVREHGLARARFHDGGEAETGLSASGWGWIALAIVVLIGWFAFS